jgi:hypothetical protein
MMNEGNTVLSQPWREFYQGLAWVMFDLNPKEFLLAWSLWNQRRKGKNSPPQTWARAFLQRLGEASPSSTTSRSHTGCGNDLPNSR